LAAACSINRPVATIVIRPRKVFGSERRYNSIPNLLQQESRFSKA